MARNLYLPDSCSWYRLDLDVKDAVRPEFLEWARQDSQTPGNSTYMLGPEKVFRESWQAMAEQRLQLTFHTILVFVGQQHSDDPVAHIDGPEYPLHTAINWCITPDTQKMLWYNLPETVTRPVYSQPLKWYNGGLGNHAVPAEEIESGDSVDLYQWHTSELEQIDQCLIGRRATLVRISKPHMITSGDSQRISISARFEPLSRSWSDTVLYLRDFIQPD